MEFIRALWRPFLFEVYPNISISYNYITITITKKISVSYKPRFFVKVIFNSWLV